MNDLYNKYSIIAVIGFVLWIAETAYFGFSAKPSSPAESFLDTAALALMLWGVIGDVATNVIIQKHYHCDTVNIKQEAPEVINNVYQQEH